MYPNILGRRGTTYPTGQLVCLILTDSYFAMLYLSSFKDEQDIYILVAEVSVINSYMFPLPICHTRSNHKYRFTIRVTII